jgi:hypothetical protein
VNLHFEIYVVYEFKMEQQPINQRIIFLLKSFKMSARTFSEAIGESPTNTQNYVGKRNAEPRASYLENILRHFATVNPLWLLIGEGEPFLSDKSETGTTQTGNFNQAGTGNTQKVKGNKNNVQNNSGDHATINNNAKLDECKRDLVAAEKEIQHLRDKLAAAEALAAAKDVTIAAKEETINLLRATYNRPN